MSSLNLDRIDISIAAQGIQVNERWPMMMITVDGCCIYDGIVKDTQIFRYQNTASACQQSCQIDIEYYGKQDQDNELDHDQNIIKTQSLLLQEIRINDVDIIKTRAIHQGLGYYRMFLDAAKYEYFKQQGLPIGDTTRTHMFENGIWHLEIELPLLSTLVKKNPVIEPWEDIDLDLLINEFLERIDICEKLETPKTKISDQ